MSTTRAYRWQLLPDLASHIEHGRAELAKPVFTALIEAIDDVEGADAELFRLRCAQCMSACLRGAQRGGAPSDVLLDEHLVALRRLARLTTRAPMRRLFLSYILRLASQVQTVGRTPVERVVLSVVADMAKNLERPKSLANYAHDLGLSVGHLSRSFSRITGRSFRDEHHRLRTTAAAELLTSTTLPLATIARRVGLLSTSQFIADFRRTSGMTPAEYRRRKSAR